MPLEILNAANEVARSKDRRLPKLNIQIVSETLGSVITAGGLSINANATPAMIEQTDLLILPSLWRNPMTTLKQYPQLLPWLSRLAIQQSIICAVGTSSYFLAAAGLLEQKAATTHWYYCDHFAKRYPTVKLKRQHLITQADNLYCAGSVNSIADLMVHLIERFYGHSIARQVEGQFSPEIRKPFADHAYALPESSPHQDETIIEAQEWLRKNFQQTVKFEQLAQRLNISSRSLNRRFKQALGITANEYLHKYRIDNAKELLRTSNITISEVAAQSGFQDGSYFCARFKQAMGQTPLAYRKAVRGKLFKLI
ncbi:GlxA family transcriptional regulator [Oceanicoccus sp. KOV_DT_Chl]|uniref:GlxA family transcriptional regulator n=1 Tax=Oceanicoccus sp. KOV_DT_Chl TaxID=1904639 RepID=UPI001F441473|nr:helix-turn-helix domain-containing protein [Oceanicoccus sp. KOV_DT_Chl]